MKRALIMPLLALPLALQLHIPFDVRFSSDGLMCASPNGPCNDVSGVDPSLRKADGDAADFLDRPASEIFNDLILAHRCRSGAVHPNKKTG